MRRPTAVRPPTHGTSGLDGPPFALARWLDITSERWWRLRPRVRAAVAVAGLLAVVTAVTARVVTDPYGAPTTVLVATRDLPAGHELGASDVRRRTWPAGLVPPGATLRREGRLALPVVSGSVLTDAHLDALGLVRGLDPADAAVAVPRDLLPELAVGDRVDVLGAGADGSGTVVAVGAVVLATDPTTVWLATSREAAPAVVAAVLRGAIGVALLAG
jgi:hypothetical protein